MFILTIAGLSIIDSVEAGGWNKTDHMKNQISQQDMFYFDSDSGNEADNYDEETPQSDDDYDSLSTENSVDTFKTGALQSSLQYPIFAAATKNDTLAIEQLKSSVNEVNSFGENALFYAIRAHSLEAISKLLELGINTNQVSQGALRTYTPLDIAIDVFPESIELLRSYNAKTTDEL